MTEFHPRSARRIMHLGVTLLFMTLLSWSCLLGVDVLTQANDNNRTGANLQETILNTSNVNPSTFGKVFTYTVNGQVYAQPLYVSQVAFGGTIGTRNVVIIATENNYVYAFDADNQSVNGGGPLLWSVSPSILGTSAQWQLLPTNGGCGDLTPTVGISGTPVIDKGAGIVYLVAKSFDGSSFHDVMHALALTTGAEQLHWPVEIQGTASTRTFDPGIHHNRPGLLLQTVGSAPTVYAAFGSHCDHGTFYGWIFSVATTAIPTITGIYCTSPTNGGGSIWQSGKGLVADAVGNIYFATGNGNFQDVDGLNNTTDKVMSVVKVNSSLQVLDFFIPSNAMANNSTDLDLGSGGPLLIPGANRLVHAGKTGVVYVLDTNALGGYVSVAATPVAGNDGNAHQWFQGLTQDGQNNCQCPVYWVSPAGPHVYYWPGSTVAKSFAFNGDVLATTPNSQGTVAPVGRQGGISISANGSTAGTGILWGICSGSGAVSTDSGTLSVPGTIYAYNAENLGAGPLWNSDQNGAGRDTLGNYSKLSYPTPANGRLYVPTRNDTDPGPVFDTASGSVVVYGLLAPWQTMPASLTISVQPSNTTGGVAITPPVQVKILDGNGNPVAGATNAVTISLGANPGGATLSGTLTVNAVGGIATFSNLILNNAGTGYTLVATSMPAAGAFSGTDIGAPAIAGSTTRVSGGFDVVGGGTDITGTSDQFQFGNVTVNGNFDLQARVNSVADTPAGGGAADYTKSGLMARSTLAANSDNALALVFPSNVPAHNLNTGGYEYQYRDAGATTVALHPANFNPSTNPIPVDYPATWLRLIWNGTIFTGYASVDGTTWTQYVTSMPTVPADYSGAFSIGLAVTAHDSTNTGSATAQFRNISLNGVPYLNPATSTTFNVATAGVVATPVIAPPANRTYTGPVTVTMSDTTAGAAIYYTLGGATPTAASTLYDPNNPPTIAVSTIIKAIGIEAGLANSTVASSTFTISVPNTGPYGIPTRPAITPINLPATLATNPPGLLSATGVFSDILTQTPSPGIIPYTVINPLWSDGATKNRYIALPPGGQITFAPTGEWSFPTGTVMIKTFMLAGKLLETRLILLTGSGPNTGYGVTYKWLANGSDAQLMGPGTPAALPDGLDEAQAGAGGQIWHYPSRNECITCHTSNAGFVLGPKTRQLNGLYTYTLPSNVTDNQLRTWNYLNMFTTDIGEGNIGTFEKLVVVGDLTASATVQARSYLDANCSYCHRPGGVSTGWNGLFDTAQGSMNLINVVPTKGNLGITGALLIYPQNPPLSVLYDRTNSLNALYKMQPLAHNVIDPQAVPTIAAWINSLAANPAPTLGAPAFAPLSGPIGTTITINGANLLDTTQVSFNGTVTTAVVSNAGGTQITVTVPVGATTGDITVTTPSGSVTSPGVFTVGTAGPAPMITSLYPTTGSAGSTIIINGSNLGGTSTVAFNGVATTFTVLSNLQLTAIVPVGATTGLVSVTTAGGTATSPAAFTVVPVGTVPIITSISPASGPAGTVVIITGTGLGGVTSVSFSGSYAAFTVNGAGTQITTTVPAGANSGPITVQSPQGIANSPTPYVNTTPPPTNNNPSSATSGKCGYGFLTAVGLLLLVFVFRRVLLKLH